MQVTRKNHAVSTAIGTGSVHTLQTMLIAGRSPYDIAAAMGCAPAMLTSLLAMPAPTPLVPMNWSAVNAVGPAGRWAGVAAITFAGVQGGFTWGAAVFANGSTDGN